MPTRALLSRIAGRTQADEVESVVAHLRALLGTRTGDTPAAPGFGIVALADIAHAFPDAGEELAASIRRAILEYEPRLAEVTVRRLDDDGLALRFEIAGELAGRRGRPLRVSTSFRPGGRVEVRT